MSSAQPAVASPSTMRDERGERMVNVQHGLGGAETTNTTVIEDGLLCLPPWPIRPSPSGRRYSARVYALSSSDVNAENRDSAVGLETPEVAHVPRRECASWPIQSIVTVEPSSGRRRPKSDVSQASPGQSIHEVSPPRQLEESARVLGPGIYKCIVTDVTGQTHAISHPFESLDSLCKPDYITYDLQRANSCASLVASKETLQRMCDDHPLPSLAASPGWLRLRYVIFSTYRRIYAIVVLTNLVAICCMIAKCVQMPGSFTYGDATTAVSANLFIAILMRHEHCVNLIFRICLSIPARCPLGLRRLAAKVYSYGGFHSSCGISAFFWYIFFTVLLLRQFEGGNAATHALAAITGCLNFVLALLIVFSHPWIRKSWHDWWEISHRFGGWIAMGLVWAQIWITCTSEAHSRHSNVALIVLKTPAFWFLCGISAMIIYPWLRLRRIKVEAEKLSPHAARIRFPNHRRRLAACVGTKLSSQPLLETHSFATIADPGGEKGYSILVSNAGDWTDRIINNPPKYLWKRGAPTIGVMRLAQLFRPIVVVATGSGIGPCMSFLQTHPGWPCRIIWSTRMPEVFYGTKMIEAVLAADQNALIIDTHATGRPDLPAVTYAVYKATRAEAVVVISNPKVTQDVVFQLEQRKVPAFGPIFDS